MRRFHPVELGILSLTSLLFAVSLYHFIWDSGNLESTASGPIASINKKSNGGRDLATKNSDDSTNRMPSSNRSSSNISPSHSSANGHLHIELPETTCTVRSPFKGSNPTREGNTKSETTPIREYVTHATQVRILGSKQCITNKKIHTDKSESPESMSNLPRPGFMNQRNQYRATVFTLGDTSEYSTDYIPLELGENKIEMTFDSSPAGTGSKELILVIIRK